MYTHFSCLNASFFLLFDAHRILAAQFHLQPFSNLTPQPRPQAKLKSLESTLTHVADTLARIATTERGLSLFLYDRNLLSADGER